MQEDTPQSVGTVGTDADLKPKEAVMSPNMQLDNKYCKGDEVWAVFSIGPNIKVGKFTIKSFNAEVMKDKPLRYMYGFSIAGDGHDDGVNLSILMEEMVFFDKNKAKEKAVQMVGDIVSEYSHEIDRMTKEYNTAMEVNKAKYEGILETMTQEKSKCNAKNLDVAPREAVVPPQEKVADGFETKPIEENNETTEPVNADPVTPPMTPDNEQTNPESDVNETDNGRTEESEAVKSDEEA